jgi:hypothetical protein
MVNKRKRLFWLILHAVITPVEWIKSVRQCAHHEESSIPVKLLLEIPFCFNFLIEFPLKLHTVVKV